MRTVVFWSVYAVLAVAACFVLSLLVEIGAGADGAVTRTFVQVSVLPVAFAAMIAVWKRSRS